MERNVKVVCDSGELVSCPTGTMYQLSAWSLRKTKRGRRVCQSGSWWVRSTAREEPSRKVYDRELRELFDAAAKDHKLHGHLLKPCVAVRTRQTNHLRPLQPFPANPPDQPEAFFALGTGCYAEGHADDVISDSVGLACS